MTTEVATKTATTDTKELREALRKVNLIKLNSQLPILTNTIVEFANGKATISTTDLERVIRIKVDSTNTESFSVLLPRKQTERFLYGADGKVSIMQGKSDRQVTLSRNGIGDLNLPVLQVSDFPPMPSIPDNLQWQTLNGKWFCRMLRIIATACATDESRPILTGVVCNDRVIAAADGFRLHLLQDNRLTFGLDDKQVIIPLDTINLIPKLFSKEEVLEVAFEATPKTVGLVTRESATRVHFKSNNISLISQLISGTFPNYQQLVPNSFDCKATFSAPLMMQRLNMIDTEVLASGIVRYIFETLAHGEQICSMKAVIEDGARYELSCPVKFEGNEAKIAFNHQYLADAIKPFSVCNLEIQAPSSPGKITGDIEGLTIVIMPMFVQW